MNLIDKYLGEEREGKYFKKGEKITWNSPDGTKMEGIVVTGDIMGKIKVSYLNKKKEKIEVLVPTNKVKKI